MDNNSRDRFSINQQVADQTTSFEAALLFNQGTAFIQRGQFKEAIGPLSSASAADPYWIAPLINLTVAYSHTGRLEEAQQCVNRAIEIQPTSSIAHNLKGTVLLRRGKYETALEEFLKAHELNPFDKTPIENSAVIYRRLKHHTKAIEFNQKILSIEPENTKVLHNISIVYMEIGNLRKSVQAEIRALKTVPDKRRHYMYLAKLLLDLGKRKLGTSFLLKEMRCFPRDPDIHIYLAVVYMDDFLRDPDSVELSTVKKEINTYLSKTGNKKSTVGNILNLIRTWQIGKELFMDPIQWEEIFSPGKFIGNIVIAVFWNTIIRSLLLIPRVIFFRRLNQNPFEFLLKSSISESHLFE